MIPARVALAAQADGWWVRCDIIWNKPNGMPTSAEDRPARTHEYIFMLTKRAKYYWNQEGAREPYTQPLDRWGGDKIKRETPKNKAYNEMLETGESSALRFGQPIRPNADGRNPRSVWTIPVAQYSDDHFAVYPDELAEKCIKAASRPGDVVLDTFAGSGTTLLVAVKLSRQAVGYEIAEEYCQQIIERNKQGAMALS